jgi:hypothetical protein
MPCAYWLPLGKKFLHRHGLRRNIFQCQDAVDRGPIGALDDAMMKVILRLFLIARHDGNVRFVPEADIELQRAKIEEGATRHFSLFRAVAS